MDIKKLMDLVNSSQDDLIVAKKIHKYLSKKPELLNELFFLNRTLFHILALKNKPVILEFLLKHETCRSKALQGDRNNLTIMHLVARQNNASDLMTLLIKMVPELLNVQNKTGNTALHDAVRSEQRWAVLCLIKAPGIKLSLKNNFNQTAYQLAGDNSELKQALLHLELPIRVGANRTDRANSLSDSSELSGSFPLLSAKQSARLSTTSSSSWESLHSPQRLNGGTSNEYWLHIAAEAESLEQNIPFKDLLLLLKRLAAAYHSEDYSVLGSLQQQFYTQRFVYDDISCFKQAWAQIPEARAVFLKLIADLYPVVSTLYNNTEEKIHSLLKDFLCALISNKEQISYKKVKSLATIPAEHHANLADIEALWLITLCQNDYVAERVINYESIAQRTLSLLSRCSLSQIITFLRLLYPQFDSAQRILAQYIVCQSLCYQVMNAMHIDSSLSEQLQLWRNLTNAQQSNLDCLDIELNYYLNQLIHICTAFTNRAPLHNFNTLNQVLGHPIAIKENRSFDRLIDRAFLLKKERVKEVGVIAQELRILTLAFYQKVLISEFDDGAWLKPDAAEYAPNIVLATQRFNKLSKYFVQKIVTQPAHNVKNAFQLLLEIAQALCPLEGENYPDLNSLMLISSAINNLNISRLSTIFDNLSEREKKIVDEINQMVSKYKNSKHMRQVYQSFRTTLPFLGDILNDLTVAKEGNAQPMMQMDVVGDVLLKIMEIKLVVNCEPTFYESDLLVYLDSYQEPSDDNLYQSSLELQPKKSSHNKSSVKRMSLKMFDRERINQDVRLKAEAASSSAPGTNG